MFKIDRSAAQAEWKRLTPTFSAQPNTIWGVIKASVRETLVGFWAPIRMAWWLAKSSWRQVR